jgi:hypothetical protein
MLSISSIPMESANSSRPIMDGMLAGLASVMAWCWPLELPPAMRNFRPKAEAILVAPLVEPLAAFAAFPAIVLAF